MAANGTPSPSGTPTAPAKPAPVRAPSEPSAAAPHSFVPRLITDPAERKIVGDGFTFDDVLLLPRHSAVMPAEADTSTRLTPHIRLRIPLVSAPMDTVTESALAIGLAQEGGIGIIHRNLPPEAQAREVLKVKRSANGVIEDPITLGPADTVGTARRLMREYNVSGFPVTDDGGAERGHLRGKGRVVGIITRRDLKFVEDESTRVQEVMTRAPLVTSAPGTTLEEASRILNKNKVEKLVLVGADQRLSGMITQRDIDRLTDYPRANLDARGRLRCGAACGVDQYERVEAVLAAGADVIVIDTSHGHSENVLRTVRTIKSRWPSVEVVAGNIATAEGARALVEAGADAVKAGIGPGSICTTRVVTGVGVPQMTAIFNAVRGVLESGRDVPVIADGGVRQSGDIAKALAAGASAVMLGSLFAGLDESPGELVISNGRRYKTYRGMGSAGAMEAGSADRYGQHKGASAGGGSDIPDAKRKFVPEGVEGLVPYRGTLAEFVYQMVGGVRAAMGYCGCHTIDEFREETRFVRVSGATVVENHPHDIRITKESPNYSHDV